MSKFLQGKNADLLAALNYVKDALTKIEDFRCDKQFDELQKNKNKFIESKKIIFLSLQLDKINILDVLK